MLPTVFLSCSFQQRAPGAKSRCSLQLLTNLLLPLGSSRVTPPTLAWEKWKADPENTFGGKYLVKARLQGTAEAARRKGRGSLEMGSYSWEGLSSGNQIHLLKTPLISPLFPCWWILYGHC